MLTAWLASLVWAGELDLERAERALAEGRLADARAWSLQAARSPSTDAWRMYLRASAAAGLVVHAEAEIAARAGHDEGAALALAEWKADGGPDARDPTWPVARGDDHRVARAWAAAERGDLEAARAALPDLRDDPSAVRLAILLARRAGDPDTAARQAAAWSARHPDRPDVLDALWPGPSDGPLARARHRAIVAVRRGLPRRTDDPLWLHRALRLTLAADAHREAARVADALAVLGEPRPLPRGRWSPPMREAMGKTLALSSQPTLPPGTPEEREDMGRALIRQALAMGRPEVALYAADQLGDSFGARRARVDLLVSLERWEAALLATDDLLLAATAPAADDRGRHDLPRQAEELSSALGARAEILLAMQRPDEAATVADWARGIDPHPQWDSLWMRALATSGARPEVSHRADILRALVQEDTLVHVTIASLMALDDPAVWRRRGALQQVEGWKDAAFTSFVVARTLGADIGGVLADVHEGVGSPGHCARAVAERWGAEQTGHLDRLLALHEGGGAVETPPTLVGRAMPAWTAADSDGASIAPPAQAYVLALWASWCGPCLVELPEIARVVSGLRAEGVEIVGVAVSVDDDASAWRRVATRHDWPGLVVGWNPDLAEDLRIVGLPTTYVVAPDGTVVRHQLGHDEAFVHRLGEALRALASP